MAGVDWVQTLGIIAETVLSSPAGALYVGGTTQGQTPEQTPLEQPLQQSYAVLAQYDAEGQQQWLQTLPLATGSRTTHLALVDDRLYALGTVPVPLPNSAETPQTTIQTEVWLAEYSLAGEQQWLQKLRSVHPQRPDSLAIDGRGFLYIAGHTTPEDVEAEGWLAKYDPAGERLWQTTLGNYRHPLPLQLWLGEDPTARTKFARIAVYVAGSTAMPLALPNGEDNPDAAAAQSWLARYSSEGIQRWITALGPAPGVYCTALTTDAAHQLYLVGQTPPTDQRPAGPWLAQYAPQGQPVWQTARMLESEQAVAQIVAMPSGLTIVGLDSAGQVWLTVCDGTEETIDKAIPLKLEGPVTQIKGAAVTVAADLVVLGQSSGIAADAQQWLAKVTV